MKNETNTQHTPAPWTFGPDPLGEIEGTFIMGDNGREFVAKIETISSDNGSGGTNEKLRNRSMQIESANAQLIARAPELLKENEQLKEQYHKSLVFISNLGLEKGELQALNAELLEAIKKSNDELSELANHYWNESESFSDGTDERRMYLNRLADVRNRMNANKSAIAKAETKTLVG